MKKFIYGFLMGFSFFVMKLLIENATTDIASRPERWLMYILFPLLIFLFMLDEKQN